MGLSQRRRRSAMSPLVPQEALDLQKAAGHLVQLLLDLISSFHCLLDNQLRFLSHVYSPEPAAIADWSLAQRPVLPRRLGGLPTRGGHP
jgi:hypothetical protein